MRHVYLLIILILLAAAAVLTAAISGFKESERDKALDWKIPEAVMTAQEKNAVSKPPRIAMIKSKSIFSPMRGEEAETAGIADTRKTAPPQFELIGICAIGDKSGAIIEVKNAGQPDKKSNKVRRYYAIGDEVYGGFILDAVHEKSAVLKRKNEILQIKIDRTRFAAEIGKGKNHKPGAGRAPGNAGPPPANPGVPPPNRGPIGPVPQPGQRGPGMPVPGINP